MLLFLVCIDARNQAISLRQDFKQSFSHHKRLQKSKDPKNSQKRERKTSKGKHLLISHPSSSASCEFLALFDLPYSIQCDHFKIALPCIEAPVTSHRFRIKSKFLTMPYDALDNVTSATALLSPTILPRVPRVPRLF